MPSIYPDDHDHGHDFPLCAHEEFAPGAGGENTDLLDRSRFLSALAGWPGPVDHDTAADTFEKYGYPYTEPTTPSEDPSPGAVIVLEHGTSLVISGGLIYGDMSLRMAPGTETTLTITGTDLDIDVYGRITGTLSNSDAIDCIVDQGDALLDSASSTAIVFTADEL